jgi:hypothetical protein
VDSKKRILDRPVVQDDGGESLQCRRCPVSTPASLRPTPAAPQTQNLCRLRDTSAVY